MQGTVKKVRITPAHKVQMSMSANDACSWKVNIPVYLHTGTEVTVRLHRTIYDPAARGMHVLGGCQKSGAPHKMWKFYTSTTTIEINFE
jgi:hypothetical protein